MENCSEANKCVVGKENISLSITIVNNNTIYDFDYVDSSGGIPAMSGLKRCGYWGSKGMASNSTCEAHTTQVAAIAAFMA